MNKTKVAFICVHNSCRSQIAEALGKHLAGDVFESYSAGTETKPQINQDAVRLMKKLYGIDMEQTQYSKLISDIPTPDIAISMGCDAGCPFIGRSFDDDWGFSYIIPHKCEKNQLSLDFFDRLKAAPKDCFFLVYPVFAPSRSESSFLASRMVIRLSLS